MSAERLVPVFPLPDVVFFPRTVLPLHVFESRYRAMVKDALAADRTFAVALLQPGWEKDYRRSPAFHPIATIGRMEDVETTHDGRFLLRLVGVSRVRLGRVARETPYRVCRADEIPERPLNATDPKLRRAKLDLLASQVCLARELAGTAHTGLILDETLSFEAAVNGACTILPVETAVRQSLLEIDDLIERHRRAAKILDEILERVLRLKSLRGRDEGSSGLN
ncbi:MAG TPA: LON peptidase substrate-binding domain-containing protein [Candidatus Polarisedimenticolaceae bacterium]|nr:LON peptidase substrate-binding domain-containing protein [Candidatus Polarisedimenticolaceae bacterium]